VHCDTDDTAVLDLIATIERNLASLSNAFANQTEELTSSRVEVDNAIAAVSTDITTVNTSVHVALLLQSKVRCVRMIIMTV
jgi:hypothetical protein